MAEEEGTREAGRRYKVSNIPEDNYAAARKRWRKTQREILKREMTGANKED